MKLSEEVRTWPLTGADCVFDFHGYAARIAELEAELAAAPQKERERLAKLAHTRKRPYRFSKDGNVALSNREILAGKLSGE